MDKIPIGRFGAAYGVRGWLHLISYTDPIENIFNYTVFHVKHGQQWQLLHLANSKTHGKGLIVQIAEIGDRELAREYTNDEIYIPKEALPNLPEDQYYWHDLIGLQVKTTENLVLGTVRELLATGGNDVIVVNGDRQRLIPYIDDVVIKIDMTSRELIVDWDPDF